MRPLPPGGDPGAGEAAADPLRAFLFGAGAYAVAAGLVLLPLGGALRAALGPDAAAGHADPRRLAPLLLVPLLVATLAGGGVGLLLARLPSIGPRGAALAGAIAALAALSVSAGLLAAFSPAAAASSALPSPSAGSLVLVCLGAVAAAGLGALAGVLVLRRVALG